MTKDAKSIEFSFKDADSKSVILSAFRAMYSMPLDDEGNPLFSDEEFVRHHIQNFILGVVTEYQMREAQSAAIETVKSNSAERKSLLT